VTPELRLVLSAPKNFTMSQLAAHLYEALVRRYELFNSAGFPNKGGANKDFSLHIPALWDLKSNVFTVYILNGPQ
jgi:hypothetical protein